MFLGFEYVSHLSPNCLLFVWKISRELFRTYSEPCKSLAFLHPELMFLLLLLLLLLLELKLHAHRELHSL